MVIVYDGRIVFGRDRSLTPIVEWQRQQSTWPHTRHNDTTGNKQKQQKETTSEHAHMCAHLQHARVCYKVRLWSSSSAAVRLDSSEPRNEIRAAHGSTCILLVGCACPPCRSSLTCCLNLPYVLCASFLFGVSGAQKPFTQHSEGQTNKHAYQANKRKGRAESTIKH